MSISAIQRLDAAEVQAGGQDRPFSKAVRAGDFVFVSGQVPTRDGEVVTGNIAVQTEVVIENIKEVLALAVCGLEHVVKVGVWLDDARDFLRSMPSSKSISAFIPGAIDRGIAADGRCQGRDGGDRLSPAEGLKTGCVRD